MLQWFILKFAVFFFWALRVSGAEAVVAAASPFIGQGESAMLIKPFVAHLTQAELHQIMCSGFATIAGSVLVAYISLGVNAQALVSSCVMSIPASLAISKLRYPEEEETLTAGRVVIPEGDSDRPANSLHAFANGAWLGLKIAGMILATLLCIIALLGLANGLLGWWGHYLNINDPPLSVELIVGYICYPIAFLLGVPRDGDLFKVSQLIGIKLIAVSYHSLYFFFNTHRLPYKIPYRITIIIKLTNGPPQKERIRRLHGPAARPSLRRPVPALAPHRHVCPVRLREHWLARHADWRLVADRARAFWGCQPFGAVGADCGRVEHLDQCEYRGLVGHGPGGVLQAAGQWDDERMIIRGGLGNWALNCIGERKGRLIG